jgi:hypothetical protein
VVKGRFKKTHAKVAPASIPAILSEASPRTAVEVGEEALRECVILGGLERTLDPGYAAQGKSMPFEEADHPRRPGPVSDQNVEPSARREVAAGSSGQPPQVPQPIGPPIPCSEDRPWRRELREGGDDDIEALPADRRKEGSNAAIDPADAVPAGILKSTGNSGGVDIGENNLSRTPRGSGNAISASPAAEVESPVAAAHPDCRSHSRRVRVGMVHLECHGEKDRVVRGNLQPKSRHRGLMCKDRIFNRYVSQSPAQCRVMGAK